MRWVIHGEGEVWTNRWLSVRRLDVEQPDGERFDYHAVRLKDTRRWSPVTSTYC